MGVSWSNRVLKRYASVRARPPFSQVMRAYAGGIVAGNLIFWIAALIIEGYLVLFTAGLLLVVIPVALAITLSVVGAKVGRRAGEATGNPSGAGTGALVGFGMAVLTIGSILGIGTLVLVSFEGMGFAFLTWPFLLLPCVGGSIAILVSGVKALREFRPEPDTPRDSSGRPPSGPASGQPRSPGPPDRPPSSLSGPPGPPRATGPEPRHAAP